MQCLQKRKASKGSKPLPEDIAKNERVKVFACDLAKPETLAECLKGSDVVKTRLEEEKLLYEHYPNGIVLRVGMVYGAGILMPDAARWFSRRFMLGIWREPNIRHM